MPIINDSTFILTPMIKKTKSLNTCKKKKKKINNFENVYR